MWSGRPLQTGLPTSYGGVGSPLLSPEVAARPTSSTWDQDSDSQEHISATQVVLGSETPAGAVPTPPNALSKESLLAHGLITDANADPPAVPSTGSSEQTRTLPSTGRSHRQELHLSATQLQELQAKLGAFTHASPLLSQSGLLNVKDLSSFVKSQGTRFAHLIVVGHQPRFRETLRKVNKFQRETPSNITQLTCVVPYTPNAAWWAHLPGKHVHTFWTADTHQQPLAIFSTVDQFATGPPAIPTILPPTDITLESATTDTALRMPDLSNVLITYRVRINGINGTALLDTGAQRDFVNSAFTDKHNIRTTKTSDDHVRMANGLRQDASHTLINADINIQGFSTTLLEYGNLYL